ncbi:hypothetical protein [Embleya sp. MST-111070]|uniref:hypothetical protein n=1 Tax=Embleya sp. MST-111070 TaxID=3398231 RepID=UPI003F740DAB
MQRPEPEPDPDRWSADAAPDFAFGDQIPNLHPLPHAGDYDAADVVHCTEHPDELRVTGIPVRCLSCGARRDWLVVRQGTTGWVRCRCAHQWLEPDLVPDDFDNFAAGPRTLLGNVRGGRRLPRLRRTFTGMYL